MAEGKRVRWEIWVVTAVVLWGLVALGVYTGVIRQPRFGPAAETTETAEPSPSTGATDGVENTGTGEQSAHRGTVDEVTRREVIAALRAAGARPVQETELLIRRDQNVTDRVSVIVEGQFSRPAGGESRAVYVLDRDGDEWKVRSQR